MKQNKTTQKDRVLQVLQIDGYITTYSAVIELGIVDSRKRISEMRAGLGCSPIIIDSFEVARKNRFGDPTRFNVYYLSHAYKCGRCTSFEGKSYDGDSYVCEHCGYAGLIHGATSSLDAARLNYPSLDK